MILVTGGSERGGRTESFMMKSWLIDEGIPSHDIIVEEESKDTVQNAEYSIPKLVSVGANTITLVTSASHMRRALLVFEVVSEVVGL